MTIMAATKPFRLPWYKRLLTQPWFQSVLAFLIAQLLRLFWLTFRINRQIHADAYPYLNGDAAAIFCFWHGRMILLPFFMPKGRNMQVLISQHRDGELIAKLIAHFGIGSIRGSSSKGARGATKMMQQLLHEGSNVSITPDGPRGPAFQASRGAAYLAKHTAAPLIPVTFSASHYTSLRSWDRFIIPHPFSRIQLHIGAPIPVAKDSDKEQLDSVTVQLETSLNHIMQASDEGAQS